MAYRAGRLCCRSLALAPGMSGAAWTGRAGGQPTHVSGAGRTGRAGSSRRAWNCAMPTAAAQAASHLCPGSPANEVHTVELAMRPVLAPLPSCMWHSFGMLPYGPQRESFLVQQLPSRFGDTPLARSVVLAPAAPARPQLA